MDRGADDRQLAERLQRDARAAAKAAARAESSYAKAVRRRARKVAKARRRLPVQGLVASGAGAWVLVADAPFLVAGAGVVAVVAAVRSVGVLRRPPPEPVRALAAPAVAPPPPVTSAAFPAVRRLEGVREELRRLIPLVAPAGREAAEEAWQAASEADGALRWQAARIAAVEPHRGAEPALLRTLEEGVSCQEKLVAAVADLVAASADPLATARLQDVTDALHGLAQGLREVR